MGEGDDRVEVLKEIRDEIRGVRSELEQLRGARRAGPGVRTEVVDRAARWRIAAMTSTGALAVVALVLALRPGVRPVPVAPPPSVAVAVSPGVPAAAPAATAPRAAGPVAPAPVAPVVQQPVVAAKSTAKPPLRVVASAPAPAPSAKKRIKPQAAPEMEAAAIQDEGDTIPFPPPRHVRVHRMSYGPVESEPAKL